MRHLLFLVAAAVGIAAAGPALAQSSSDQARFDQAQQRFDREYQLYREEVDRFRSAASGPRDGGYDRGRYDDDRYESGYDPARYYRNGTYQERVLATDERVYRGNDGRYYCKRNDGTTGLIVGGAAGGVLGNVIDGGHSRTVGTLLGAAVGAIAGRAVDQNNSQIRCR